MSTKRIDTYYRNVKNFFFLSLFFESSCVTVKDGRRNREKKVTMDRVAVLPRVWFDCLRIPIPSAVWDSGKNHNCQLIVDVVSLRCPISFAFILLIPLELSDEFRPTKNMRMGKRTDRDRLFLFFFAIPPSLLLLFHFDIHIASCGLTGCSSVYINKFSFLTEIADSTMLS